MKAGIIIYCHNDEDAIEKSINSVLEQDYLLKEIVVVDDASTDRSWEKVGKAGEFLYSKEVDGTLVTAISHEFETGMAGAFISGINLLWSHCDIFGLLRASDCYLAGKLSRSIEYIKDYVERVGIIYSDYHDGRQPIYQGSFNRANLNFDYHCLVTKHSIETVGMIDQNDEVVDFWSKITEKFVAIHIPEVLVSVKRSETCENKKSV